MDSISFRPIAAVRPAAAGPAARPAPTAPAPHDPVFETRTVRDPATGAQVTRVVDAASGDVVIQLPPQQVLNIVARLLERVRGQAR